MTNTAKPPLRVLLIDDDHGDQELIKEYLSEPAGEFLLDCCTNLRDGVEHFDARRPDVLLLDLHLPDSQGLDTFFRLENHAGELPIVIVTGMDDEATALEAVRRGAQDYLVKGRLNSKTFPTALRYAVARHRSVNKIARAALFDRLTGLYNREGFQVFAEQHLKSARRDDHAFFVFFAVLDGLDVINEKFGKGEGDQALSTMAAILRESFRTSDVIARVGSNEFAIIAPDNSDYSPTAVTARLKKSQTYYDAQYNRYRLSISVSATRINPRNFSSTADLIAKADQMFTDYKKNNTSSSKLEILK
jgi:two-component system, cell cycle response regulator